MHNKSKAIVVWTTAWILLSLAFLYLSTRQISNAHFDHFQTAHEKIESVKLQTLRCISYMDIKQALRTWEQDKTVERFVLETLPPQLKKARYPKEWKAGFIYALMPSVLSLIHI